MRRSNKRLFLWTLRGKPYLIVSSLGTVLLILMFLLK